VGLGQPTIRIEQGELSASRRGAADVARSNTAPGWEDDRASRLGGRVGPVTHLEAEPKGGPHSYGGEGPG
jgi:hypothetical protein